MQNTEFIHESSKFFRIQGALKQGTFIILIEPGIIFKARFVRIMIQYTQRKPVWEMLAEAERTGRFSAAVTRAVADFRRLIHRLRRAGNNGSLVELVSRLIDEIGYKQELARIYTNPGEAESRWASVVEILHCVRNYVRREPSPTLAGFVHELALADRDAEP